MGQIQVVKYKRGPFGTLMSILFWAFNILMVVLVGRLIFHIGERGAELATDAEKAGLGLAGGIGFVGLLVVWVLGAVILGALKYFTRGQQIIETRDT